MCEMSSRLKTMKINYNQLDQYEKKRYKLKFKGKPNKDIAIYLSKIKAAFNLIGVNSYTEHGIKDTYILFHS